MAAKTRLSLESIGALEEDRFDDLPGEAFIRGYVRSYAGCIGLSPDEAVLRYREWRLSNPGPEQAERPRRRKLPLLLAAAALASAGAVLWLWRR